MIFHRFVQRTCLTAAIAALALACAGPSQADHHKKTGDGGEWTTLFDGETLDGWTQINGKAEYEAKDGAIVGHSVPNSPNSFLCTKQMYGDFVLEFEVKVDDALNSGVQIRSKSMPGFKTGRVHGPQVEIEAAPGESGYIYSEGTGRGWLSKDRSIKDTFNNGQWNHYRVRAEGDRIQTWVNGTKVEDLKTPDSSHHGFIGLQVHGVGGREDPLFARWRNIRIKPLDDDRWTTLFNRENLDGWHNPYEWGEAKAQNGRVVLVADDKFFLTSDKEYGDFVFEASVKLPDRQSNSGLQFRSHEKTNKVYGYQAEVDPSDRAWAGGLYDEGRRGWLAPLKGKPSAQQAFKPDEWNRYRIHADGDRLRIYVNGVRTTDYRDPLDMAGHFALQHHGEDGKVYRFRDIRVDHAGKRTWQPLFNGENLDGWHPVGGGEWKVKDGVLIGTHEKDEPDHGILASDRAYSDFVARIVFKVNQGNSGLYFRSEQTETKVAAHGFQAEVSRNENVGGLYETGGRKWVTTPKAKLVRKHLKPDGWNTMYVSAHGDHIVVHLNGKKLTDIHDTESRRKGIFGLQLHGNQKMDVRFKDISILSEPGE